MQNIPLLISVIWDKKKNGLLFTIKIEKFTICNLQIVVTFVMLILGSAERLPAVALRY